MHLVWVPSHGKCLDWQPPFNLGDSTCHDINDKANRAANQRRDSGAQGSSRVTRHRRLEEAERWEVAAISGPAASSAVLFEHLKLGPDTAPVPPPEVSVCLCCGCLIRLGPLWFPKLPYCL